MKKDNHPITDHALIRYIERVLGGDIKAMKDAILRDELVAAIKAGAHGITIDGFRYAIKDRQVITVYKRDVKKGK